MLRRVMRRSSSPAVLFALVVLACGPTLGVHGQLVVRAREQMGCEQLTRVVQLTENAFEVDGCGRMVEYTDSVAGEERDFRAMTPAATLAAEDTHCAVEQLAPVGERAPTHRTYSGCGSTASYVLACQDAGGCHWERDGAASTGMLTAPAVPPGYGEGASDLAPGGT